MTKLHLWHPDNLEAFARECFARGKELVREGKPTDVAERFFSLSNQAFDMAASLRIVLADCGETPVAHTLQWNLNGDSACGRYAIGLSTGGFFGIEWGAGREPVATSETMRTSAEVKAWCESRAATVDTPVVVGAAS